MYQPFCAVGGCTAITSPGVQIGVIGAPPAARSARTSCPPRRQRQDSARSPQPPPAQGLYSADSVTGAREPPHATAWQKPSGALGDHTHAVIDQDAVLTLARLAGNRLEQARAR